MISNSDAKILKYLTPYRYSRPVIHGSGKKGAFDEKSVDIPFVFWHRGRYYMIYTGFDGIGYQSALAISDNLVDWEFLSLILKRNPGSGRWDENGGAVTWALKEDDSFLAVPRLRKKDGKYWLIYHSYPGKGYEAGAAEIGLAWCGEEDLLQWHCLEEPILSWKDGKPWEAGGLYKACMVEKGGLWYLFYNAKDQGEPWKEQIGMAVSKDFFTWQRMENNPILRNSENGWDQTFVSDPYVLQDGDRWLCFYYGIGKMDDDGLYHAEDGLAFSEDLIHWEKVAEPILKHGLKGMFDEHHAHKPAIFYENGILYHFYCATCEASEKYPTELFNEYRTICVAASAIPDHQEGWVRV